MEDQYGTILTSLDNSVPTRVQLVNQAPISIGNNLITMTTSDLDLRKSKGELFSKLIERQPQQMIVTTPSKTSSDDNLTSLSRTTNDLSRLVTGCRRASSKSDLSDAASSVAGRLGDTSQQQELVTFSKVRSRWYTNEEVASILTSFSSHPEWQTNELQLRPKSGAVLLYSREKVRYRQDGYCWKKRKNGRTTREDHMKLKVQGIECIYGCYVHSAILPTFHRRCYWLLENPDIVLVHYLNQPPDDRNKMILTFDSSVLEADTRRRWTNEEIIEEIGAVFGGISQIHHTLNINFPAASHVVGPQAPQYAADNVSGLLESQEISASACQADFVSDQMDISSPDEHILTNDSDTGRMQNNAEDDGNQNCGANNKSVNVVASRSLDKEKKKKKKKKQDEGVDEEEEEGDIRLKGGEDDEMVVINSDGDVDLRGDNNNNNEAGNSATIEVECSRQDQAQAQAQAATNGSLAFEVSNAPTNAQLVGADLARQQSVSDYDLINSNVVLIDNQDDRRNLLNNSKNFYESTTITQQNCEQEHRRQQQQQQQQQSEHQRRLEQSPNSPVTQIYNKIVDDIETYVLSLEPDQFNPNHHHHHHHHHHHQQQHSQHEHHLHDQGSRMSVQATMAGGDPVGAMNNGYSQKRANQASCHRQLLQDSKSVSRFDGGHQSIGLTSCDLFNSCTIDGLNSVDDRVGDDGTGLNIQRNGDMLLSDFNLAEHDGASHQVANDDTLTNGDLMMGIQSTNETCDGNGNQTQHLLMADTEALDLFGFKPSDCESDKNQLDIKSTTSETDAMSRLSPMIPVVPRCNSTDNALRTSMVNQHLDQYQHHASNQFLSQDHSLSCFAPYNGHAENGGLINCSATSTDPSNSTSCSVSPSSSPLLAVSSGAATMGIGCQRDNGISSPDDYIKLPLQQRQNSEQKEPSNSVLSSLLPKALSLDGSDLSSRHQRHQHYAHHGHRHSHSHNHPHPHHHHHHQNHHNLRTSPLIGSYGSSHSRAEHSLAQFYAGTHHNNQNQLNHQILSTPPSAAHLFDRHQASQPHQHQLNYYNRATGSYSFDANSANKILVNGGQYRSSSVATQSSCPSQQPTPIECRRLHQAVPTHPRALPILDYVPNWAPNSGGTKLLLIGNWTSLFTDGNQLTPSAPPPPPTTTATTTKATDDFGADAAASQVNSGSFSVLFDDLLVPATLIQDNVIRCYSPQHEPGVIPLKVLHKDLIVSQQVLFEIRSFPPTSENANNSPSQMEF